MYIEVVVKLLDAGYKGGVDLESLIQACGEMEGEFYRFFLCRQGYHDNPICWVAGMWDSYDQMDSIKTEAKGDTPSEAVANLWLKLNQK